MIRDYLILLSWLCAVQGKIGYFWHITDIHYDPTYATQGNAATCSNMRNSDGGWMRLDKRLMGKFGNYSCDSPWALVESAARAMRSKHSEGIEFVLWTGDALTRNAGMNAELRLQCLRNLTDLLHRTFKGHFVFPALGHEDIGVNYTQLASLWQNWLPPEAVDTFVKAGYYTIEQRSKKYRIVFLNTNLWLSSVDSRMLHRAGSSTVDNTQDPFGQWSWFQSVLENARKKKETVGCYFAIYDIIGLPSELLYRALLGRALLSSCYIALFRRRYTTADNDHIYVYVLHVAQILDYTQYYLNLPEANSIGKANWIVEYSLLDYYELQEISAITLHDLADRFTQSNDYAFVRYYAANTVSVPREVEQIWGCGGPLNGVCALHHYCTVTRLNPETYKECYSSYAYALASTGHSTVRLYFALHLLILLICAEILNDR
ncbi:acid sphingomyelinase-like phosphodiesterase 3a [Pogonomyrmex barbatus]|uniref:Acid sphingomyelinase-like phosphodiesterase 3a n=1 Tax=Pogonomyrmex barbatus TaxID=144034 RepID=A0A6I9WXC0_9HYME|nr:acid sphingomyelinase-like phosphodiesterase 3a [Pogonomyrmex barbatus]